MQHHPHSRVESLDAQPCEKCPAKELDFSSILTEDDFERIANAAATAAVSKMKDEFFKEVGKSFFSKFTVIVGIIVVGLAYKLNIILSWFK